MSDTVITVENLGKRYSIRHQAERQAYVALRDVLAQKCAAPFRALSRRKQRSGPTSTLETLSSDPALELRHAGSENFWALTDVNFSVSRGEVVGIIGRNGAGKSTLLKILSRITEPTKGRVRIKGRVASLLEVGTGFHSELTGRENIFLNGAILGMTRLEIIKKFDEIVAFAEIEKFLDTPVKRYSSGMYVRLAFAVAAHLEPEILIVDEVLAVGDAEFQKKCLGRMQDVSTKEGRTVLFVSHDMGIISSLCDSGLHLESGRGVFHAKIEEATSAYMSTSHGRKQFAVAKPHVGDKPGISAAQIVNEPSESHERLTLALRIFSPDKRQVALDIILKDSCGSKIAFGSLGTFDSRQLLALSPGEQCCLVTIPTKDLANGVYHLRADLCRPDVERYCLVDDMVEFEVCRSDKSVERRELNQNWRFGSFKLQVFLDQGLCSI
jgi:lipopolysaccharide transport system ATP-binding protein